MNCPNCGEVYKKAPLVCLKCNSILAGSLQLNKKTAVATKPIFKGENLFENLKNFLENSPNFSNGQNQITNNSHQSIRGFAKYYPVNDHSSAEVKEKIQQRVTHSASTIQRLDCPVVAQRQISSPKAFIEKIYEDKATTPDETSISDDKIKKKIKSQPKRKALDKNQMLNVLVISAYVITIIFFLIYYFRNTSG